MYIRLFLFSAIISLASFTAKAGPMYAGYELNESTNIVSGGGLEWLQWDVTDGMSINNSLSTYGADGWVLADNTQMASLFQSFFGDSDQGPWDADENTPQSYRPVWNVEEDFNAAKAFNNLFGCTLCEDDNTFDLPNDQYIFSGAWFGAQTPDDGLYNYAFVHDDFTFSNNQQIDTNIGIWHDNFSYNDGTYISSPYGVALVRQASVPEPTTLALMGLGLAGFGLSRKRRIK